ncbi:MAG: alpha/beta fold hydrolase [Candidatus Lokiarchaeota archaeon]|nr:alpha/beta fold hydrolase [Candidatus Lokiarchaeota archaeon]MBD3201077.1 alpha/beta fold hydrolase [Candidatus Lokiarchaeota archaeon]
MLKLKEIINSKSSKVVLVTLLFVASLMILYYQRSFSYDYYERIEFQSGGARLYANLHYPNRDLTFQEKHPLVIFAHAFASQRDLDLRVPLEFAKRGFFVASIDYQGHGESGGAILNLNEDDVPALARDCSNLLDKLETLSIYSQVNKNQIALIGHSFGGMVVLMNDALDERFNATVTWAGLVSLNLKELGFTPDPSYTKYIPENLINTTNVNDLLVIHHLNDPVLPYEEHALVAQNRTGCDVIKITEFMFGFEHFLLSDWIMSETIIFVENQLFGSSSINGPINITYMYNYLILIITLIFLLIDSIYLERYFASYFKLKKINKHKLTETIERKGKNKISHPLFKLALYIFIFVGTWAFFSFLFGFNGLIISSLVIIIFYILMNYLEFEASSFRSKISFYTSVKNYLKSQLERKVLVQAVLSTAFFVGFYLIFSLSYPFAFFFPSSFLSFLFALTGYPIYLSLEIFHRKIIYPALSFIKSAKKKTIAIILIIILVQILFYGVALFWIFIPEVVAVNLVITIVLIKNSLLYERTQNFLSLIVSSFLIIQIFFGATISTVLGLNAQINYLFWT